MTTFRHRLAARSRGEQAHPAPGRIQVGNTCQQEYRVLLLGLSQGEPKASPNQTKPGPSKPYKFQMRAQMIFLVFLFLVDVLLSFVVYVHTCLSQPSFHYMGFGPCPKGLDTGPHARPRPMPRLLWCFPCLCCCASNLLKLLL